MKIQAFIFNWKGHEAKAAALEARLSKFVDTTVINSEENLNESHPGWISLDDSAYFSAQWNAALGRFDADILFHMQADADVDDVDALLTRAESVFATYDAGVYEPNVDYTDIQYDNSKLKVIEPQLFEVPFTDCTCWFISRDVLGKFAPIDLAVNRFGWGIPRFVAALTHLQGKICVRDYRFTVQHPKGRGYPSDEAFEQFKAYFKTLSPEVRDETTRLEQLRDRLRPRRILTNTLIITAASSAYGPSLLALLGSLNLNWPNHPPVLVYDIGLDTVTLDWLKKNRVPVKRVPPFCRHWRQHYTWKLWCLNDAPAQNILWMDAGLVVLQPLNEILATVNRQGYFLSTHYESLEWEASEEACEGCGVPPVFRDDKLTIPATLMGFRKDGVLLEVLEEALEIALVEKHIAATGVAHRFEQAILSLLLYKKLGTIVIADGTVYLGALSPRQVPGQKVWLHRRRILQDDIDHYAAHITEPGEPHLPEEPEPLNRAKALSHLYRVYWYFGQGKLIEARENLDMTFRLEPALKQEPQLLATRLHEYMRRLQRFGRNGTDYPNFISWVLKQLQVISGEPLVTRLQASFHRLQAPQN